MATSRLGQATSTLGSMRLGNLGSPAPQSVNDTLTLSDSATESHVIVVSVSDTLSLVSAASADAADQRQVTDTLSLVDTADNFKIVTESVSSSLALTDSASATHVAVVSIVDTLSLVDLAHETPETLSVHDTLSLVDSAVFTPTRNVADTLSLNETIRVVHAFGETVTDTLSLVSTAVGTGGDVQIVHDSLALVDTVFENGPWYESVSSVISLIDTVSFDQALINISVNDPLSISQFVSLGRTEIVSDIISLTDTASHSVISIADTLTIVDMVSVQHNVIVTDGNPFGGILQHNIFSHTVHVNQVTTHTASTTISLADSVAAWVESAQDCVYAPFIGATADLDVVTPPPTQPTLTGGTLTLTWPFVSPSLTVVLRNPEYDNKFQYQPTRINRETRGGTLIIFADPVWPKLKKLEFTVTYLQGIQMQNLQAFLLASIGQSIGLRDWEGQQWEGVILNPDAEISNAQRGNWSIGLQFEGVLT